MKLLKDIRDALVGGIIPRATGAPRGPRRPGLDISDDDSDDDDDDDDNNMPDL